MDNIKNKILKMPVKENKCISEDDILSLFMGLIKLVKKNAKYEAVSLVKEQLNKLKSECDNLKNQLNKALVENERLKGL